MNNSTYKVLLIIVLALLLIVGIFFIFFYSWSSKEIVETSTPQVTATYQDPKGYFSVQYPEYYGVTPMDFDDGSHGAEIVGNGNMLSALVSVKTNSNISSLKTYVDNLVAQYEKDAEQSAAGVSFTTKSIVVDGVQGYVVYSAESSAVANVDVNYFFLKNKVLYNFNSRFSSYDPGHEKIIADMAAAFRFTNPSATFYENEYMKIAVPVGWTATEAMQKNSYGTCTNKGDCTVEEKIEPNPAAVNITKGNYILYINAQASQASGVEGGRFNEYAGGAPSVEAVITEWPADPCYGSAQGTSKIVVNGISMKRTDLFVGARDTAEYCRKPASGTVWYFSYIGSGINYFDIKGGPNGWVVSMAYNSRDVNLLPKKGSVELNTMLAEMSSIVKTLELKQK